MTREEASSCVSAFTARVSRRITHIEIESTPESRRAFAVGAGFRSRLSLCFSFVLLNRNFPHKRTFVTGNFARLAWSPFRASHYNARNFAWPNPAAGRDHIKYSLLRIGSGHLFHFTPCVFLEDGNFNANSHASNVPFFRARNMSGGIDRENDVVNQRSGVPMRGGNQGCAENARKIFGSLVTPR